MIIGGFYVINNPTFGCNMLGYVVENAHTIANKNIGSNSAVSAQVDNFAAQCNEDGKKNV